MSTFKRGDVVKVTKGGRTGQQGKIFRRWQKTSLGVSYVVEMDDDYARLVYHDHELAYCKPKVVKPRWRKMDAGKPKHCQSCVIKSKDGVVQCIYDANNDIFWSTIHATFHTFTTDEWVPLSEII